MLKASDTPATAMQSTARTVAPLPHDQPPRGTLGGTLGDASSMQIYTTQDKLQPSSRLTDVDVHNTYFIACSNIYQNNSIFDKKALSLLRPRAESAGRQRSGSRSCAVAPATPQTQRSGTADATPDIDAMLRKNRRRFEYLLANEGGDLGPDELEILVGGLQDISSRPTTASR